MEQNAKETEMRNIFANKVEIAVILILSLSKNAAATAYNNTTLDSGQRQVLRAGDTATSTTVNSSGEQLVYGGLATSTTVNSGGRQDVSEGGSATSTTVNSGSAQNISDGGLAMFTTLNSGGFQLVSQGGTALSTEVNSGSFQNVDIGGYAMSTSLISNASQLVSGGSAASTVVNAGSSQIVSDGGLATFTTVNSGGSQVVRGGGRTTSTTLNFGASQVIRDGGSAISTIVNSGAKQNLRYGVTAISTTLNSGGTLSIQDGATAVLLMQKLGGIIQATTGANITGTNIFGAFNISGGQAVNLLLEEGGILIVSEGNKALDTTVNTGGTLNLFNGGELDGVTTINEKAVLEGGNFTNNGNLIFNVVTRNAWAGSINGDGDLTKNGDGELILKGTLEQSKVNFNAGSLVMDNLHATTDIAAVSGTSLFLINNTTLTGIIEPTNMSIDKSSKWNITKDSQLANLTNAGNVVFLPSQGFLSPHILTLNSLTGNGGTITLNTVAGDSSSPVDKVIIDGGRASGRTGLRVLNQGGLGAQTTGNGIAVIQAINGATTDTGAFNMTQPLAAGAYSYSLYRNADQSWYLTSQQTQQTQTTQPAGNDSPSVVTGSVNYRDAMWSYAAMPSLSMDYDRLVAGTADTRFHYAPDSRVWGRVAAGRLRHLDSGSVPESSSAYSFFQLGGDLWQLDGANADWRAGVFGAAGLMRSDVWRDGGSADAGTDRDTVYTGGAYVSGRSLAGLHIDGLLQASRHNLKAASNDDTRLSTRGTGWLASAEVGQAFSVSPALALEPQLQYQVQGLSLNDGQDEAASLSWSDSRRQSVRAGLKLGTPQDAKATLAWWVTPSVTQSYAGHSGFTVSAPGVAGSEASFRSNLSGTSVGLNGGVNARIRQNVTLGVQGGWSESLQGGESGGYYGLFNLDVSFR